MTFKTNLPPRIQGVLTQENSIAIPLENSKYTDFYGHYEQLPKKISKSEVEEIEK